jgi:hypothetical protein
VSGQAKLELRCTTGCWKATLRFVLWLKQAVDWVGGALGAAKPEARLAAGTAGAWASSMVDGACAAHKKRSAHQKAAGMVVVWKI